MRPKPPTFVALLGSALLGFALSSCTSAGKVAQLGSPENSAENPSESAAPSAAPCPEPSPLSFKLIRKIPKPPRYTQGFAYSVSEKALYEGSGLYGKSGIFRIDPKTGHSAEVSALEPQFFGEGIAIRDSEVMQLTWREGRAFLFRLGAAKPLREFSYTGDGWGLAWAPSSRSWLMSDGSYRLQVRDSERFESTQTISVRAGSEPQDLLNELEFAQGALFANVYGSDRIVRIHLGPGPQTGCVTGVLDLQSLLLPKEREKLVAEHGLLNSILNGIAFDPESGDFFVTGKNWPYFFRIRLSG